MTSRYYSSTLSSTSIEDDHRSPRELVPYDDDTESRGDTETDVSMATASWEAESSDGRDIYKAPSIVSSGSDMSISIDSRDEIYPYDSVSQRAVEEIPFGSDAESIVSFHSSLDGHLFRELYGRAFNSQSDNYMLPVDDIEHTRLDLQHNIFRLHLNGLYPAPDLVRAALSPDQPERPSVLDIGTGSGRWVLEMAMEFPHAEVVGLDLAPPTLKGIDDVPPNCRFEVDNANLPLDHYEGAFNVVHVRGVELGIVDYNSFLYNIARTLKPGGLAIIVGGYPQLYDENYEPLPVTVEGQPGFTWAQRMFGEVYAAFLARADNAIDSKQFWAQWITSNPNFEDAVFYDAYIPLGPWPAGLDERQTYAADLMRYNCSTIFHAYKPILLLDGIPRDTVDRMIENTVNELRDLKARAYVRWLYVWMKRTTTPWTEKLETPEFLEPQPSVYFTEEFKREKAMTKNQRSASVVAGSTTSGPDPSYVS